MVRVASTTLSINCPAALPLVEYDNIATRGSASSSVLADWADAIAMSASSDADGFATTPQSANMRPPPAPTFAFGPSTIKKKLETSLNPGPGPMQRRAALTAWAVV